MPGILSSGTILETALEHTTDFVEFNTSVTISKLLSEEYMVKWCPYDTENNIRPHQDVLSRSFKLTTN